MMRISQLGNALHRIAESVREMQKAFDSRVEAGGDDGQSGGQTLFNAHSDVVRRGDDNADALRRTLTLDDSENQKFRDNYGCCAGGDACQVGGIQQSDDNVERKRRKIAREQSEVRMFGLFHAKIRTIRQAFVPNYFHCV